MTNPSTHTCHSLKLSLNFMYDPWRSSQHGFFGCLTCLSAVRAGSTLRGRRNCCKTAHQGRVLVIARCLCCDHGSPLAYARQCRERSRAPTDHPTGHVEATRQGARVQRGFSGAFPSIPSVSRSTATPPSSGTFLESHSYRSLGCQMVSPLSRG